MHFALSVGKKVDGILIYIILTTFGDCREINLPFSDRLAHLSLYDRKIVLRILGHRASCTCDRIIVPSCRDTVHVVNTVRILNLFHGG